MKFKPDSEIKSHLIIGGFLLIKSDYLFGYLSVLSVWIANLGVVPLFLLAAFLFVPAFFFFLSLLFVVTHVLETIRQLLIRSLFFTRDNYLFFNNIKPYFLPTKIPCVKEFFLLSWIFLTIVLPIAVKAESITHDIVIAKGQSTEIILKDMVKFNIGNHQVLTYTLNEKTKKLLIRGKEIGHSEILVWKQNKTVETYQVFIVSKAQEAKLLHIASSANRLELSSLVIVPHVKITGELKTETQYFNYKQLLFSNKEIIFDDVSINLELRNEIMAKVYTAFF